MGETKGCKIEVVKIAEDTPRFLEAKGVTISTFLSVAEPGEITEYFKTFKRNFLVFELDKDVSGFNLTNDKIQEMLFGHLDFENTKSNKFEDRTNKLIDEINNRVELTKTGKGKNKSTRRGIEIEPKYRIKDDMTKVEITKMIDSIIDKGVENFTDYDREILNELSKRNN